MASLILVSNDDGIQSPGLKALAAALENEGEVWVVAPDGERSTSSHSLTLGKDVAVREAGPRAFAVGGWPADSVYIALFGGLLPRRPDLVVSGINRGANLGTDVIYSGTVAAAREAWTRGFPAIAMSLVEGEDYSHAASFGAQMAREVLRSGYAGSVLNVNLPAGKPRGVRVCTLGKRLYPEKATVQRQEGDVTYYRLGEGALSDALVPGSDGEAVESGYVAVTPLGLDSVVRDDLGAVRALSRGAWGQMGGIVRSPVVEGDDK